MPGSRGLPGVVTALLLGLCQTTPSAATEYFRITGTPAWVEELPVPPADSNPDGREQGGVYWLLSDLQTNVIQIPPARYAHFAWLLLDESGVQSDSHIAIEFDPGYQALEIHRIGIWRDGVYLNRLRSEEIKVLQREEQLEFQMYDGRHTAILFLEDVRVGDIVDYSYTLTGSNPALGGIYSSRQRLGFSLPMQQLRRRVLWSSNRSLFIKNHFTDMVPQVREHGDSTDYVWERTDLGAVDQEDFLPIWYEPYPWVQMTEFRSWAEVVDWGVHIYQAADQVSPQIEMELENIRSKHSSSEERLLAVVRFVQDEVRYLGIEMDVGSFQPSPPGVVLERRFGDCKDKTILLVCMLRQLGFQADPSLVHSHNREAVIEWLPTPLAFNHVIARVLNGADTLWVDPTVSGQKGGVEHIYVPNFGWALVMKKGEEHLRRVTQLPASLPRVYIEKIFIVKSREDSVNLTIQTDYKGQEANEQRTYMNGMRREEVTEHFRNYYENYFPGIRAIGQVVVKDNEAANVLRVLESYRIPDFWKVPGGNTVYKAEFYPMELDYYLPDIPRQKRRMPIGVSHPGFFRYSTTVHVPKEWTVPEEDEEIVNKGFRFHSTAEKRGQFLLWSYEYETLSDHVPPEASEEYLEDLHQIRQSLGYELTWGLESGDGWTMAYLNWPVLLMTLLVIGVSTVGAVLLYRLQPVLSTLAPDPEARGPIGLGGWLVFLTAGTTLRPILLFFTSVIATLELVRLDTWVALTVPGAELYHPMWAPVIVLEICVAIIFFVWSIQLVVLLYKRKRGFPTAWLFFGMSAFVIGTLDIALTATLPEVLEEDLAASARDLIVEGFSTLIWGLYLFRSKRVKATFVN